jgi:Ca2+-binding RTX toxin-like protein
VTRFTAFLATTLSFGNDGGDLLVGGGGKDTLTGGAGADFFEYLRFADSSGANVDLITDFNASEGDVVFMLGLPTATNQGSYNASFTGLQAVFVYNAATNVTTLSYHDGSSTPVFQLKFTGNVHYDRNGFESIAPGSAPTEGDDDVVGTANADTVDLLGGSDTYSGLGGNDSVAGGSGNDQIFGDDGNDNLRGGQWLRWH